MTETENCTSPRPPRVLVADDDEEFRSAVADIIALDGWHVCQASDGEEALHCTRCHHPDVLLLDHRMPTLTGVEVVKQLRAEQILVPVVMVSAAHELEELADSVGVRCRLMKPFGFDELSKILKHAVEGLCLLLLASAFCEQRTFDLDKAPVNRQLLQTIILVESNETGVILRVVQHRTSSPSKLQRLLNTRDLPLVREVPKVRNGRRPKTANQACFGVEPPLQ